MIHSDDGLNMIILILMFIDYDVFFMFFDSRWYCYYVLC